MEHMTITIPLTGKTLSFLSKRPLGQPELERRVRKSVEETYGVTLETAVAELIEQAAYTAEWGKPKAQTLSTDPMNGPEKTNS